MSFNKTKILEYCEGKSCFILLLAEPENITLKPLDFSQYLFLIYEYIWVSFWLVWKI